MTTFTRNYTNRQVDVLAFDGAAVFGDKLLQEVMAQPGEGGKIVAGVQKLAQRFLLELLTEQGSMRYFPDRGSTFITEANSGRLYTQLDVYGAFARAVYQIKNNLISDESASDPLDERFASATIDAVATQPGAAYIYVTILSRAGTSRTVILPIHASLL